MDISYMWDGVFGEVLLEPVVELVVIEVGERPKAVWESRCELISFF